MSEFKKELVLLFIYASGNSIYFLWSLIFIYLTSYSIYFDPQITLNMMLLTTPGFFIGIIIANSILPSFYNTIGIKNTMIIGSVLYLINLNLYCILIGFWWTLFNTISSGIIFQFGINSLNYFLSTKYKDGILYSGYCMVGQNITTVIWVYFGTQLVNPENKSMENSIIINGIEQKLFSWEVARNLPTMLFLNGFVSFLLMIIPICFLNESKEKKIDYLEDLKNEISIYSKNEFTNISINESELLLKVKLEDEKEKENLQKIAKSISNKILSQIDFIILIFLISIRNGTMMYFLQVYKVISDTVLKSDHLTSDALSLSIIFNVISKVLSHPLWKKLDFYWFNYLCFLVNMVIFFLYLVIGIHSKIFMFIAPSLCRTFLGFFYISGYYTVYGIYEPHVGVYLNKVFDSNYLIGSIMTMFLNYCFFNQNDIVTVFNIIFIANIFSFVYFALKYKNFKESQIQYNN